MTYLSFHPVLCALLDIEARTDTGAPQQGVEFCLQRLLLVVKIPDECSRFRSHHRKRAHPKGAFYLRASGKSATGTFFVSHPHRTLSPSKHKTQDESVDKRDRVHIGRSFSRFGM